MIKNIPPDRAQELCAKWFKTLGYDVPYEAKGIIVTPYTTEEKFEYHKNCDWPICLVHGLEDKNGDVYVLWDNDNKKMRGRTLSKKRFNRKYFIEAL